jgi:UTP--glucose-1-phosphate uridylyltransferase
MKNSLKKIVIPIAGLGTRMLPATKAIPKEMLPVVDKPIIQYIVEEAVEANFNEIIFITHSSKASVENHFDKSFELEATLEKRVKRGLLKEIKSISRLNVTIQSIRQGEAKGLGHAILCSRSIVGDEPFAITLPDMLISSDKKSSNLLEMKNEFEISGDSSILLGKAKESEISKYGIVKLSNKKNTRGFRKIEKIIEKPKMNTAPSRLFAAGRYIFTNKIFNSLSRVKPDKSGEIQLTDAIQDFLLNEEVISFNLKGELFDCGDKLGYLKAIVYNAQEDEDIGKEFKKYIKKVI